MKQKPSAAAPKVREPVSAAKTQEVTASSAISPKTKAEAAKDSRKAYVSNKLKTKAEYQKQLQNESAPEFHSGNAADISHELIKGKNAGNIERPRQNFSVDKIENTPIKPQIKTKESYMQSLRQRRAELVKSPYRYAPRTKQQA